jgi:hypothetical protein
MAPKTYTWISLWFLITAPVIAWDVGYCFMRPRSFEVRTFIIKPNAEWLNAELARVLCREETCIGYGHRIRFTRMYVKATTSIFNGDRISKRPYTFHRLIW